MNASYRNIKSTQTATEQILLLVLVFVSGCHAWTIPARTAITTPSGAHLEQSGAAAVPATVSSAKDTLTLPLPANSAVAITAATATSPARVDVSLTAPTVAQITSTREQATAPKSFTPPAPPSPSEIAKGKGIQLFYYIGGALAVAAVAMLYLEHAKAALVAGIGAVAVPGLAVLLSSEWAVRALVACVALSGGLVAAWYFIKSKHPAAAAAMSGDITALRAKIIATPA